MSLEITSQTAGDVTLIRCSGRISIGIEEDSLQAELTEQLKTSKRFVVNLSKVTFLDSSGMGLLVRFASNMRAGSGGLKLCNLNEALVRILRLSKLDKALEIYEQELDAVNSFYQQVNPENSSAEGAKVICIDASVNVLAYLSGLLAGQGFSAVNAATAYDARTLLKAMRPALVVLGPHVPGVNNEHFQQALKGIPVLALGSEFHAGEAGAAAEILMNRIKAAMDLNSRAATP